MDHDGITDILYSSRDVSNGSTKAIQYTKRNAAGFYLETITLSESIRTDRFAVADLDADGSTDVIVVDTLQNGSLVWFKNNGNGTFNTKIITKPDFTLTNFIPINMDGDNDIDMLSLYNDNGNQEMAIYINDGTGIFTPGQTKNIGVISNIAGLFPIDWDNDQRQDLIVSSNNRVYFCKNYNNQILNNGKAISLSKPASTGASAIDINKDGLKDIVSIDGIETTSYLNLGNNTFSNKKHLVLGGDEPLSLFADLDQDQDMDLIRITSGDIKWYANDGTGNFGYEHFIYSGWRPIVRIKDIDQDGDMDMIFSGMYSDQPNFWYINIYKNDGTGTFSFASETTIGLCSFLNIEIEDFNGDSYPDICYGYSKQGAAGELYWLKNDGVGNFSSGGFVGKADYLAIFTSLKSVDIDADGDKDIFLIDNNGNVFYFFPNNGNGNFGASTYQFFPDINYSIYSYDFVDLDQDGDPDMVTGGYTNGIRSFINNGDGTFETGQILQSTGNYTINLADIDSDGDIDIVSVLLSPNTIGWYENTTIVGVKNAGIKSSNFSVSPNPAFNQAIINIQTDHSNHPYNIVIQDIRGKTLKAIKNCGTMTILNRDELTAGIYLASIYDSETGHLVGTKKLIWE